MSLQFDVRFFEVFIDHHYFKVRIKSHIYALENYFNTEVLEHKWGFFIFTKYGSMKTIYKQPENPFQTMMSQSSLKKSKKYWKQDN